MTMDGVLRLYFGESNVPTPAYIVDAAVQALRDGHTFYSENAGLPAAARDRRPLPAVARRRARSRARGRRHRVGAPGPAPRDPVGDRSRRRGDHPFAGVAERRGIVALSHGVPVEVPLALAGEQFEIDFAALEAALTTRTRLVLLTSPSNPLGWVARVEEQRRLLDLCRERGLWLVADEVYERIYYGGASSGDPLPRSPPVRPRGQGSRRPVVLEELLHDRLARRLARDACRPGSEARAAQRVLRLACPHVRADRGPRRADRRRGRARADGGRPPIESGLLRRRATRAARRHRAGAAGAFYLFPRIDGLDDSMAFCRRLLLEQRVGLAPGSAFGAGGEGALRSATRRSLRCSKPHSSVSHASSDRSAVGITARS